MENNPAFSVAMCVYRNDKPSDFEAAVNSIYRDQTLKPSEVIVVVDGAVPQETESVLHKLSQTTPLRIIRFSENKGHAAARQAGLKATRNEIVALMDADDISVHNRFEKQLAYLLSHPNTVVLGGQIDEFIDTPDNVVGRREVPCGNEDILIWLKGRCPFNQMTVTMLRSPVLAAGGYMDWYCNEDYYLWNRLALTKAQFANLPDVLVNVRVGADMYRRRGGWKYFRSEARLQGYMLRHKVIGLPRYIFNVAGRFVIQVALPNRLRGFIFQKLFRK